jgi:hypothetical protein
MPRALYTEELQYLTAAWSQSGEQFDLYVRYRAEKPFRELQLNKKGMCQVGGMGDCALINRRAGAYMDIES